MPWIHVVIIAGFVGIITAFHYWLDLDFFRVHDFLRRLYFIPVILASLWWGLPGDIWSSAAVSAMYLPRVRSAFAMDTSRGFDDLLEILVLLGAGALTGLLETRRKKRDAEAHRNETLAQLGSALAILAHEIKTPIVVIGGFARVIHRNLTLDHSNRGQVEIIIREANRLEVLVRHMLMYARPDSIRPVVTEMNALIREVAAMFRPSAQAKGVLIQEELEENIPLLSIDRDQVKQVMVNLVENGLAASREGQVLTLFSRNSAGRVVVAVRDQGDGVPAHLREKIFHPFFSTRGQGTGLGLSIARKIVEAHKGTISYRDHPEGGALFEVALPVGEKRMRNESNFDQNRAR
ncbi:MAG: hypothetical protein JRI22_19210 [Deltaproteobacteria bacterium]|nr:hypothetical protein [Deltaproteobacteria bacterium]